MAVVSGAWSTLLAPGLAKAMSQQPKNPNSAGNAFASFLAKYGMNQSQLANYIGQSIGPIGPGSLQQALLGNQFAQQQQPMTAGQLQNAAYQQALQQQMSQQSLNALMAQTQQQISIAAQQAIQGNQAQFNPKMFGLGFGISQQMLDDVAEDDDNIVWKCGDFKVKRSFTSDQFWLTYKGEDICTWDEKPSRRLLALTVKEFRKRTPQVGARDIDETLIGVRYFRVTDDGRIYSPTQQTLWTSAKMEAEHWADVEVVRGTSGIHAAWPPRDRKAKPIIDHPDRSLFVAYVRGYGRYVQGTMGWRAQKVIIDTIFLPPSKLNRDWFMRNMTGAYPDITFEAEPWTLERLSKSEK